VVLRPAVQEQGLQQWPTAVVVPPQAAESLLSFADCLFTAAVGQE
jgi:hypothetical protein